MDAIKRLAQDIAEDHSGKIVQIVLTQAGITQQDFVLLKAYVFDYDPTIELTSSVQIAKVN